jgi:hypothetical protein
LRENNLDLAILPKNPSATKRHSPCASLRTFTLGSNVFRTLLASCARLAGLAACIASVNSFDAAL